jgi:hypothetical protein
MRRFEGRKLELASLGTQCHGKAGKKYISKFLPFLCQLALKYIDPSMQGFVNSSSTKLYSDQLGPTEYNSGEPHPRPT